MRADVFGVDPLERAEAARERIDSIVEKGGPLAVSTVPVPEGFAIQVDGHTVFRVLAEDVVARGLESLPANLLDAIGELELDDVLRTALGKGREGEDYVDYYARVKRDEWFRYHEQVTPWELREYLTRF